MSFVLLLLLSITTLTQVEIRNAKTSTDALLARENARLGIMVALGKLQKSAGPDERITVRSDAFGDTVENPIWTGVLPFDDDYLGLESIDWLVSLPTDSTIFPNTELTTENSAVVVSEIEASTPEVRVPTVEIEAGKGSYGFWVSDESLKASLATRPVLDEQSDEWLEDSYGKTNAQRLNQVIPKRAGIEMLFDAGESEDIDEEQLSELKKFNSKEQFELSNSWDLSNFKDYYHSITDRSFGILASTTGSGLRIDASRSPELLPISGAFDVISDFEDYMETPLNDFDGVFPFIPWEDDLRRRYKITAPTIDLASAENLIVDGVYPVITDFKLIMSIHAAGQGVVDKTELSINPIAEPDELVIRLQMHVELWNPYTSALVPENLVIHVSNLPVINVEFVASRGVTLNHTLDLDQILAQGAPNSDGYYVELPFDDRGYSNHDDVSWLPGRVYNWVGQNNYSNGNEKNTESGFFYSRDMNGSIWYQSTGITIPNTVKSMSVSAPDTDFTVSLRKLGENGDVFNGDLLSSVENINYDSFDTGSLELVRLTPLFGFQIQRNESGFVGLSDNPWEKSNWLRVDDPRNPKPQFDDTGDSIAAFLPPNGIDPTGYVSTGISESAYLFDRVAGGSGLRPSEDIPLFELLRQNPISVGELQHLQILGKRPYTIGNSWGSADGDRFNRIFDEVFFSGLTGSPTAPDLSKNEAFPNHRLRRIEDVAGGNASDLEAILDEDEYSSKLLMSEGAFNLNSTSGEAWAMILGSILLEEWEISNINDTNGDIVPNAPRRSVELGQSILRFPQSAQEVFHTGALPDNASNHPLTEYFRSGAKHFKDSDDESDTVPYLDLGNAIAKRISERIQRYGPFKSIEAFLSPVEDGSFRDPNDDTAQLSVIERAVLDVAEINQSEDGEGIWHHTSSYLSQADIMTGISPVANVRGDSFIIRAVGTSGSGFGPNDESTIVCEARVQRVPTLVDPTDDIVKPDETAFGRRFQITAIRWLDSNSL